MARVTNRDAAHVKTQKCITWIIKFCCRIGSEAKATRGVLFVKFLRFFARFLETAGIFS